MNSAPEFDPEQLASPAVIADPYPFYRQLRSRSPFRYPAFYAGAGGRSEPLYAYALLRFADVAAVLRDHETFSSQTFEATKLPPRIMMLQDDPPRHTQLRRIASRTFSPKQITDSEPWIRTVAWELCDKLEASPVDFMSAYANPLPMAVMARLLGVPTADYPKFRLWSTALLSLNGIAADERTAHLTAMAAYLSSVIRDRQRQPAGDLITTFVSAEIDGQRLTHGEVLSLAYLMLVAGNETTAHLIGNLLGILADRPHLYQRVRDDRSLVDAIIGEALRYESPVQRFMRVATKPTELAGVKFQSGDILAVYFGAANRDPEVFTHPDTFLLDRPPHEHLAFGQGIHFCLGSTLARAEARITLNEILDRFAGVARAETPAVRQGATALAFGYQSLPLRFSGK